MMQEIPFDIIMKNHRNWPDELDVDNMSECIGRIKRIKNRIFFEEKPEHPEVFVIMFSMPLFIDWLLDEMVKSGITNLNKIWLREYPEEDKQRMLQKGVLDMWPTLLGLPAILMQRNQDDFFVSIFL